MEKDVPYIVYESEAARHERTVRHRAILKSRLIDGLTYDELSEMYYMSPRQIKRIVYKSQEVLFRHI